MLYVYWGIKNMSKLILEIDGMQLNKKMYDANLYDTFPAIVYNQKPFLRDGDDSWRVFGRTKIFGRTLSRIFGWFI